MRIHAAAPDRVAGPFKAHPYPYLLASFALAGSFDGVRGLGYEPASLLVDSGAFTAWTLGRTINLDEYRQACRKLISDPIAPEQTFINLDVIPGQKGKPPTDAERHAAQVQSLKNADILRGDGLPIIEVHHQYESWDYLHELVRRRRPGNLLGLSARNDQPTPVRMKYLDGCFYHLTQREQLPPCHGFGLSTDHLVRRYPWATCDSTSWVIPRRYGERIATVDGRRKRFTERGVMQHDRAKFTILAMIEILQRWDRLNAEMTLAWERRGIVYEA